MDSWANSGLGRDLHVDLTGSGGARSPGLRAHLISALRESIRSGRLVAGATLPPSRTLALDLGIARNTVAEAYAELVAEGWLTARQGSGTRVADRAGEAPRRAHVPAATVARPALSLMPGSPDVAEFPRAAWMSSARRALTAAPNDAFGPGDPRGRPELRRALAEYLSRARGVRTDSEHIVVSASSGHGLWLLGRAVAGPIAVEGYGLHLHRELLGDAGVGTVPLHLDTHGAQTPDATGPQLSACLLTPAHQFPIGGPLHPGRRTAFVEWARTTGGFVIEDDYDGEFRYDRQPVGALQGLAPDEVAYLGTVSKSLSPAIRVGWMVLPERLIDDVLAVKGLYERWVSATDQLTLADFIERGAFDRHVRRMRTLYRRRRDTLVETLAARAPHVHVTGIAAGLHAVLELPAGTETATVDRAASLGLAVEGLRTFRHPDGPASRPDGLVVGYSTPSSARFAATLDALCRALPTP
ncbi:MULTISPECIES: PLP-dependent aminotransferase family protein [unclassified Rhodococcus (in: high G+C Gram-positive bacteria)]|uniref:MocR-like pyridoxine biosynthesis transcription factor PdxR n=1 Tax=unclassified Rhodococcus (in: high G+C Gram-positive bacteria) TaxID=192944 RepID=UPI0016395709|nr:MULTISPECIES: PLP-dependent aminotransferase family protein [unclassified Rhodococcus (in: high G+C Gram-positive bacteria)]MBC2642426.1 PLP-dependent aminotransferase family protein [Rhodococcus sp. 3A]MBC2892831.1 PLP-dependent aminotransferase family protein [Rhodococcus sp. 4CII]